MKNILQKAGLNTNNSIVIGSGILQALSIRKSKDIDIVTKQETYDSLKKSGQFGVSEKRGQEILTSDMFEIVNSWNVLGEIHRFEDFIGKSTIIDGVRYITLDFLYKAKKSWVRDKTARPKDVEDIKLIERYLSK